jgi:hypothetical protein
MDSTLYYKREGERGALETIDHDDALSRATDILMEHYGHNGSGRGSALRLLGVYVIYKSRGAAGLRAAGFSRNSITMYIEKLHDVGLLHHL